MIAKIKELMYQPQSIRNIGICAHIDHGKTTLSDNLLAGAGMISEELAGDQRFLDFDEQEQARGITIDAANVSMVHEYHGDEYLINLIDTPGHVDFGGDVTRAMRAVDGAVVVVCAVEGIMPQTETVLRQAPKDKKDEWLVKVDDGSVAFGSAYHNWAINIPMMQETGINFKDIIDYCNDENQKELAQKVPLAEVLLGMVVEHLPSPEVSQDIESEAGQTMVNTSPDGPLAVMVTNVSVDKHAGEVATGRVYGGTVEQGTEVFLVGGQARSRVQQVGVFFGPERVPTEKVPAGNIVYITGAKGATAGETICSPENKLRQTAKEDPTIHVNINEETGEHLVSGMGELHLEVIGVRINNKGVDINTSEPIVVYRETVAGKTANPVEGKSPNKHNRLYLEVAPLEDSIFQALQNGDIKEGKIKDKEEAQKFIEHGLEKEEARRVWDVYNKSLFINMTRGIQYLDEIKELVIEGFESALEEGPVANEIAMGMKFTLVDAKLHEDAVHRGPAQILPAIRNAIKGGMMMADPTLLEPVQKVFINTPTDYMGSVTKEILNRRGQIVDMPTEGDMVNVEAKVPVAEMFGFAGEIRSATIRQIRERKGLSPQPFGPDHYLG